VASSWGGATGIVDAGNGRVVGPGEERAWAWGTILGTHALLPLAFLICVAEAGSVAFLVKMVRDRPGRSEERPIAA
jgi:hypothetical protein